MTRKSRLRYNPDSNFDAWDDDRMEFADPGGTSALRAAHKGNPCIYSCPTCHTRNVLTRKDKDLGYQCNSCADATERGGP